MTVISPEFREQAAVGIGDDAQDMIGQPSLEQLEDGDPARALGPDGLPGGLPELPDAHDDVIEVRSDDHGVDPAGVDVQVTDGAVADIRAAPRQAVLEVRARFQMVAPAPAPEAVGDGASLDVDGLHVHAVPPQLVRDPGHSGAPGADGNVVVCPRQAGARASAGNSTRVGDKLPPAGSTGCVPARDRGMAEDGRAGGSAPSAMKVLRVGRGIGRQQQGMAWLFRVTCPPKPPLLAGAASAARPAAKPSRRPLTSVQLSSRVLALRDKCLVAGTFEGTSKWTSKKPRRPPRRTSSISGPPRKACETRSRCSTPREVGACFRRSSVGSVAEAASRR